MKRKIQPKIRNPLLSGNPVYNFNTLRCPCASLLQMAVFFLNYCYLYVINNFSISRNKCISIQGSVHISKGSLSYYTGVKHLKKGPFLKTHFWNNSTDDDDYDNNNNNNNFIFTNLIIRNNTTNVMFFVRLPLFLGSSTSLKTRRKLWVKRNLSNAAISG
jgi:hypothetical protein